MEEGSLPRSLRSVSYASVAAIASKPFRIAGVRPSPDARFARSTKSRGSITVTFCISCFLAIVFIFLLYCKIPYQYTAFFDHDPLHLQFSHHNTLRRRRNRRIAERACKTRGT